MHPLRPETKGQAGACPDRTRAIPCTVREVAGRAPEPCARYVPDGIGGQGNSRPMKGTYFLPLTSHGTGQSNS